MASKFLRERMNCRTTWYSIESSESGRPVYLDRIRPATAFPGDPKKRKIRPMRPLFSSAMRKILASAAVAAALFSTGDAAAVTQLDGTVLPVPTPANETQIAVDRGFLASDDTLSGLFAVRGEKLDPIKDAHQTPEAFSPQCGFTGKIVLHGGGCKNALGWYNVTPGSTTPPAANQIYDLVPADLTQAPPLGISCMETDFCPMA